MQGYLFMFFSLYRQREVSKRELVARFDAEGISTLRTGLRNSLRSDSPRPIYDAVLSRCIPLLH
ncbi:MAG: hypothetical protein J6Z18_05510, partial [Prevotella sp.]|nr:hypothetical protein [Prevotella sp.]